MSIHRNEIVAIADAQHGQPFQVLGPHQDEHGACIRAYHPMAVACWIVGIDDGKLLAEAKLIEPRGVFEAALTSIPSAYRLRYRNEKGDEWEEEDPYRFASQLSEFDLHLLREGTHYRTWEKLGAHLVTIDGVHGVRFVVWAPNAKRVSVVGDFNQWDGRRHAMRKHEGNGLWEIFVPGVGHGDVYKFEVFPNHGELAMLKADPFAFYTEVPPKSASRVYDLSGYSWKDDAWMAARAKAEPLAEPVSVYEVHLGSWMHKEDGFSLSYREAAHKLAAYVKEMGFTHVELLPITEHPFYGSWGYQTMHFFAPTSRFGTPSELMEFIDVLHENGIGVILDWVPAHFPTDGHGLAEFDGTHLYEHADPREGIHRDWNTMVFNYGRTEVWNFLLASALFWMEVYHFDGIRVDAVASMLYRDYSRKEGDWIPNRFGGRENLEAVEFIKHLNVLLYQYFPGVITIAEESTAWAGVSRPTYLGGLGFTFKWNMGWMHDVLATCPRNPSTVNITRMNLPSACYMPIRKTSYSRFRTTRWYTVKGHCFGKCQATIGKNLPITACCLGICLPIQEKNTCSWVWNSASGTNGTTTEASIGIFCRTLPIKDYSVGSRICTRFIARNRLLRNSIMLRKDSAGSIAMIPIIPYILISATQKTNPDMSLSFAILPPCRGKDTASGCLSRGGTRSDSTAIRGYTGGATWETPVGCKPNRPLGRDLIGPSA